jgi:hypothetical protein
MDRRLGKGEWILAELGAAVAEGFSEERHVSRYPLRSDAQFYFVIGWDSGFSPSAVCAQNCGGQWSLYRRTAAV